MCIGGNISSGREPNWRKWRFGAKLLESVAWVARFSEKKEKEKNLHDVDRIFYGWHGRGSTSWAICGKAVRVVSFALKSGWTSFSTVNRGVLHNFQSLMSILWSIPIGRVIFECFGNHPIQQFMLKKYVITKTVARLIKASSHCYLVMDLQRSKHFESNIDKVGPTRITTLWFNSPIYFLQKKIHTS